MATKVLVTITRGYYIESNLSIEEIRDKLFRNDFDINEHATLSREVSYEGVVDAY